jgi:hypothetical protein
MAHPITRLLKKKSSFQGSADFGSRDYENGNFSGTQTQLGACAWYDLVCKTGLQTTISNINDKYIAPILNAAGLTQEQQDQLKADAALAIKKELQAKEAAKLRELLNIKDPNSVAGQASAMIANIQANPLVQAIPGGIYTIVGGAGLIAAYYIFRNRRAA